VGVGVGVGVGVDFGAGEGADVERGIIVTIRSKRGAVSPFVAS
jgi:hypothetical protein